MTALAFIAPESARNLLLIAAGCGYLGYHLFGWWRERHTSSHSRPSSSSHTPLPTPSPAPLPTPSPAPLPTPSPSPAPSPAPLPTLAPSSSSTSPFSPLPDGEELFVRARAMRHHQVPDYHSDGLYLDLLGESAAKGCAAAMAKLGEYAMRRMAWVEAYYWMSLAKRNGQSGSDAVLRELRRRWALDGFVDDIGLTSPIFSAESGAVGLAFLHLDSGRNATLAREFLKTRHPELINNRMGTVRCVQ